MTENSPALERLKYTGDIAPVLERTTEAFGAGSFRNFSIIGVGYEDCNVKVETERGKYVAKIFQKERTSENIKRYSTIMRKALEAGVNHPKIHEGQGGEMVFYDSEKSGLSLVLMDFVEGKTFFEMGRRPPTDEERRLILEQAVRVNSIDYHPIYNKDSWAVPNIQEMFDRVREFIQADDLTLVEEVLVRYSEIPVDGLPHCFVHGDFTKTNVIKGDDGKIYILDFSVANWYPRIQELAVIAANLLHDEKSQTPLHKGTKLVAEEYNELKPLTSEEKGYLYPYALSAVAMEFMGGHQEKFINGNDTDETDYWINLGREGLRQELL